MYMFSFCQRYLDLCGIDFTLQHRLFFILKRRMINNKNFDMKNENNMHRYYATGETRKIITIIMFWCTLILLYD